jgi:hypothetical protein
MLAFVVLATAVMELERAVQVASGRADFAAGMTRTERDLAPARALDLDPALVLLAEARIPEDATYHIVVAEDFAPPSSVTLEAIRPFGAYWLLPRRQVDDAGAADWILSYGVPPDRLPVETDVIGEPVDGQWLLRVHR